MSDTEEVVIKRTPKAPKNTKPEIAREKLKEKRERLKKEKDDLIINEAKKRIENELIENKLKEELELKQKEDAKNTDPTFLMMKKLDEMMSRLMPQTPIIDMGKTVDLKPKKRVVKKVVEEKPKPVRKARMPKQNKDVTEAPSNNFVGYAQQAPEMPIYRESPNLLASYLSSRRNMSYA